MTKADIDKIRFRSKSKDKGPWITDYAEMCKKTVIRRHAKLVPLSVELDKAVMSDQLALSEKSQAGLFISDQFHQAEEAEGSYDLADKLIDIDLSGVSEDILKKAEDALKIDRNTENAEDRAALLAECKNLQGR